MRPLSYYIDKCITIAYVAAVVAGVLSCTVNETKAADDSKRLVNIRCVASVSGADYMSADDFLLESEKPADKENITQYLNDLKKNGLGEKTTEEESTDEEVTEEKKAPVEEVIEEGRKTEDDGTLKADPDDWRLILVNKQNPLPDDYEVNLSGISDSMMADERIIDDIYNMVDAAEKDGVDLMICSAYRSFDRQKTLFNNKINKLMGQGMTYLEAYKIGSMNVTVPGTSEHHLGLALDILTGGYTMMDDGFGDTEAGKWLAKNAPDYGFILRYPKGKEEITGIVYEPWHFRYVGKEYAREITKQKVTLEEFLKGDD